MGENGVNEVSYLILDCMDEMKLLQPSSNVQISKKTPTKFLKRACEIREKDGDSLHSIIQRRLFRNY